MSKKITAAEIESATITNGTDKQEFLAGDNLYLVVKRSSDGGEVKYWSFRYRWEGRRPKIGLGSVKDVSLKDARGKADEYRALLRDGIDPKAKKEQDKAVELAQALASEGGPAPTTLRELFERWHADYVKVHHDDGGARIRSLFELHILPGGMGDLKLQLMKREHVKTILDRTFAKGVTRTNGVVLDSLRQMVNWAAQFEWMERDPTLGLKKKQWKGESVEDERALSEDELVQLNWRLKKSYLAARWKHACWFITATGTRVEETVLAERQHINWSLSTWTIPVAAQKKTNSAKAPAPHVVHLSKFAKKHLEALLAMPGTEKYVFPARVRAGDSKGERPANNKTLTQRLANLQGVEEDGRRCTTELLLTGGLFGPHSLRRTMSTLMGELGVPPNVIDKCQNHVIQGKIQRTYQRAELRNAMAAAWDALGDKLQALSEMPDPEPDYLPPPPKAKFLDVTDVEAVKAHEKALKSAPAKKHKPSVASRKARNSRVAG